MNHAIHKHIHFLRAHLRCDSGDPCMTNVRINCALVSLMRRTNTEGLGGYDVTAVVDRPTRIGFVFRHTCHTRCGRQFCWCSRKRNKSRKEDLWKHVSTSSRLPRESLRSCSVGDNAFRNAAWKSPWSLGCSFALRRSTAAHPVSTCTARTHGPLEEASNCGIRWILGAKHRSAQIVNVRPYSGQKLLR